MPEFAFPSGASVDKNTAIPHFSTIALACFQSGQNLGDTAILEAAVHSVRTRKPGAFLVGVTPDPDASLGALGIGSFPLFGNGVLRLPCDPAQGSERHGRVRVGRLRALLRVFRFVGRIDALVFAGGGQIDDFWGGASTAPFWLLVWTSLARLRGVPVSYFGVGADRISHRASRWLFLRALALADYRAVRDEGSRDLLRRAGLKAECDVCPDLAFNLDVARPNTESAPSARHFVVVTPASYAMWANRPDGTYKRYIESLASLCRHLIDAHGLEIRLLSTQGVMDTRAIEAVAGRLPAGSPDWTVDHVSTLNAYLEVATSADLVVSSRLHGLILPLVVGVPVVAVSPMRKMSRLMQDMALESLCVELDDVAPDRLIDIVERALGSRSDLRSSIARRTLQLRAELDRSYDALARRGLLGP
jgi:polysaccharide pyruvyl transferase WcaK-like protein